MMKELILSSLPQDHPWRDYIHCYDTIPSTNDLAKEMAKSGAPEGTVVIAQAQTAGRGRLGRSFHAPKEMGIYLSLILRPNCPMNQLMHLTCATGVAMCDAIENCAHFRPQIKWINDLIAKGKKLGGILTELSINHSTGLVDWAIVGIGINCCHMAKDFPPELMSIAISLLQATGRPISPVDLAPFMIKELFHMHHRLFSHKDQTMELYRKNCITLGREVVLLQGDTHRRGKALDIDEYGGLIMAFPDGTVETVQSGEVSVRDFSKYV